jgi:hypothetical protein
MPRIHRVITLAAVTVATAITLSTTAKADDDDIDHDARRIQRDQQDTKSDFERTLHDAERGRPVGRDIDRLREDQRNTQEDRRRFQRDVDERVGDPGDDSFARSKGVHPNAVTKERPKGHQRGFSHDER